MSVSFYEVYLELEEDFDIRIMDDATRVPAEHVGELFDVVISALRDQHPERFASDSRYEEAAWEQYKTLFVTQLSVKPDEFVRSAHFVNDLKLY